MRILRRVYYRGDAGDIILMKGTMRVFMGCTTRIRRKGSYT